MLFIVYEAKEKHRAAFPPNWYLALITANSPRTEILRLRLRMTLSGGKGST
jgi:hypothetical protein